jgi:uroporphyrinogen-III synthase
VNGPIVLNTRPREQSAELSRLLTLAGFDVVEAPAIAIVPAWHAAELEAVRRDLRSSLYDWVILQSRNAGRGLESDLRGARVVCGAATAAELGVDVELALERFSASAALDAMHLLVLRGDRVLVPRAAEGRDELVSGLRALGADVHAPVAYETIAVADAAERLRRGGIGVVTLCSPSAARSVGDAVAAETLVVCLGETTAEAAREVGLRVDRVAESTTMAALVSAVQAMQGVHV